MQSHASFAHRFSTNIDTWRFILIFFVVLNHGLLLTLEGDGMAELERAIISLTRSGVPALSLFSGYLFARPGRIGFNSVIIKKVRSLILPFILWNSAAVAAYLFVNEAFEISPAELVSNRSRYDLINTLTAFYGAPANAPLYFLRDLFICFAAFALLRPVLRQPIGLAMTFAIVVLNYATDLDGRIIIRNTIPVFFLMGCGLRAFPYLIALCGRMLAPLALSAVVLLSIWVFSDMRWGGTSLLDLVTLITFSALVVGLAGRLEPIPRIATWGRYYSFMIFLSHWWVLCLLQLAWKNLGWGSVSYRFVACTIAVLMGVVAVHLITRFPDPIAMALSGGRVARGAGSRLV